MLGLILVDKADMGIRLSIFTILLCATTLIAFAEELGHSEEESTKSTKVETAKEKASRIINLTSSRTGAELLAYGKVARDTRKFDEALTFFQAALAPPAGRTDFETKLKNLLVKLDNDMENKFQKIMGLPAGYAPRGESSSPMRDGMFTLLFEPLKDDPVSGKQRLRFLADLKAFHKPEKEGGEAKKLTSPEIDKAILFYFNEMAARLGSVFKGNPLILKIEKPYFILEGYFNTDYPYTVAKAYLELARTYQSQGDLTLALKYYDIIQQRKDLHYTQNELDDVAYKRIDILSVIASERVEKELRAIIARDPQFNESIFGQPVPEKNPQKIPARITAMVKMIESSGIDKALQTYRLDDNSSRLAHLQYGIRLYQSGREEDAITHLSYAVFQSLILVFREIRKNDPSFELESLSQLLQKAREYPELIAYLKDSYTFQGLYYLALTIEKRTSKKSFAIQIFRAIAAVPEAGNWVAMSKQQLK